MARLKGKNEVITGPLDPKYWVQKSDPLVLMRSVPFSLGELKILDTYISRINAADDSRRTVIFTKEEYEELMGLTCVDYRTLQKHTKSLLSKVVELEMPNKEFLQFVLFEQARYYKDEYGKPIIELSCTNLSKDLFFCIKKYHYFKYALENIINLTRKASYLLYLHVLTNRFRGEWDIDLDELRDTVLDCKGNASYQEYKVFKRDVLDPAVKEINKKTDCHFAYEALKRGRRVAKIKFIYQAEEQIEGQLSFNEVSATAPLLSNRSEDNVREAPPADSMEERLLFFSEACDNSFSIEQMQVIFDILVQLFPAVGADLERYDYLYRKYHELLAEQARKKSKGEKPILHRDKYLVALMKKDLG